LTLATFGVYTRDWMHIDYPDVPPSVGRFEAQSFDPVRWRPEYPNPAFDNMRPDDAFWAARLVARFSAADVRAVVEKARFSDPRATDYVTATLVERRRRVVSAWLTAVNPLVDFALDPDGSLTFGNAAVAAGVATSASRYRLRWSRFDNATGAVSDTVETEAVDARAAAPGSLLASAAFVQVEVAAEHPQHPAWARPVVVHFRRDGSRWTLVGLRRLTGSHIGRAGIDTSHCTLGPACGGRDRRVSGTGERASPKSPERGGECGEHGCDGTLGGTAIGLALDIGIEARSGSKSASGRVVDDLGIDVLVGAVDAQTRTTIGASLDGLADALLAPFRSLEGDGHLLALPYFFLPSLRAMYSPT